ncbi:MAG: DUF1206 domain-containing protein [Rhodanobacteraceae bacterium]
MSITINANHDHRAAPWLRWVARCGILAEGMIYVLIGGLAFAGAFDPTLHPSGSNGAMSKLARVPLGRVMLALLALGLAAFVLWQLVLAVLDPEYQEDRWRIKRVALRIHHLWNGAIHCVLVGIAAWQLLGLGHGADHGHTQKHLTAMALRLPGGRWLVGGIGAGIVVFALAQWILACRPQQDTRMHLADTPLRRPILFLLVLGYVARGALFGFIGTLLIHAAWLYDPSQVAGVAGALQSMRHQPYGRWLLGAVAIGLIGFGFAQIAKARYRQIRIE